MASGGRTLVLVADHILVSVEGHILVLAEGHILVLVAHMTVLVEDRRMA